MQEAAQSETVATGQLVTVDHSVRVMVKVWTVWPLAEEDAAKVAEPSRPKARRLKTIIDMLVNEEQQKECGD